MKTHRRNDVPSFREIYDMRPLCILAAAAAITALPLASSFAGNGSDTPPQTQSAAVPGPTVDSANGSSAMSTDPQNGTAGGGMTTGTGKKAGGMAEKNSVHTTGAPQTD